MLSNRVIVLFAALFALLPNRGQTAGFETRPLTGLALQNVTAFTRLLGYVRYFHPSDQAAAINWEAFAVYGIGQVEAAQAPADLANTLQTLFAPIAPTVLVYPAGQTPPVPPALQPGGTTGLSIVRWDYLGFPSTVSSPYSATRIYQPMVNGTIPADASGIGPGAILNQDGAVNSATRPADRGTVVQIFATGAGASDTAAVDGSLAAAPLAHPALPVSVRIGGLAAEVDYSGAAPGLVSGMLQVNARIPAAVPPGAAAVFVNVGDAGSQPGITVYVR